MSRMYLVTLLLAVLAAMLAPVHAAGAERRFRVSFDDAPLGEVLDWLKDNAGHEYQARPALRDWRIHMICGRRITAEQLHLGFLDALEAEGLVVVIEERMRRIVERDSWRTRRLSARPEMPPGDPAAGSKSILQRLDEAAIVSGAVVHEVQMLPPKPPGLGRGVRARVRWPEFKGALVYFHRLAGDERVWNERLKMRVGFARADVDLDLRAFERVGQPPGPDAWDLAVLLLGEFMGKATLEQVDVSPDRIRLTAITGSFEEVESFRQILARKPRFEAVELLSARRTRDGDGVRFRIAIRCRAVPG